MKKKIFATIAAMTLIASGGAQEQILSLEQLLERAFEANYAIRLEALQLDKAVNNNTLAPVLPSLGLTARATENMGGSAQSSASVGAALNWRLFDGLGMFAQLDRQKQQLSLAELSCRAVAEEIASNVINQYNYIISLKNRVQVTRESMELSQLRYKEALDKYKIKSLSGLEMRLAKTDLNADSTDLVRQVETLDLAYITLNTLLDYEMGLRGYIHDTITLGVTLEKEDLLRQVLRNNTQLEQARQGELIADIDLRLARAVIYPTLDFSAGYNLSNAKQSPTANYSSASGGNIGLSLGFNIFDGLETRRKIRNAQLDTRTAQMSARRIEQAVLEQFSRLYINYNNNLQLIEFETQNSEAAKLNLEVAMDRYRLGELSGIDFRSIQQQYLAAVDRKINVIYQAKSSAISLIVLSGRILTLKGE